MHILEYSRETMGSSAALVLQQTLFQVTNMANKSESVEHLSRQRHIQTISHSV